MRNIKKITIVAMLFCLLMTCTAWANVPSWESVPGHHGTSVLLDEDTTSSRDSYQQYGRGEFLSTGSVEIVNRGNGEIYICVDTFAYRTVDRILHQVFLEYWDEDFEDWVQVGNWFFQQTKEETPDGELGYLTTTLTLTGYPTGLYYRVRGLHGVEFNGEVEACSTRTDGVLITDR